jgi:hypothetical protein
MGTKVARSAVRSLVLINTVIVSVCCSVALSILADSISNRKYTEVNPFA